MIYFEHLRKRIGFPVMQAHCAKFSLPTAQGWDKLNEKLTESTGKSVQSTAQIRTVLESIFRITIPVGDRAIRIFQLPDGFADELAAFFLLAAPEESEYMATYPAPLPDSHLAQLDGSPKLCEISKCTESNAVNLVFCNRRYVEEKDPRTKEQMGDELLNKFGWDSYDEFIFIKKKYVQSYEIVRIEPGKNLIELRVESHTGIDILYSLEKLQEKVNGFISGKFDAKKQLVRCVNLFSAIKDMYNDPAEGMVVELGFTTETGSAKSEKMRRSDLRTELFHVGGKAAVKGVITPFRLAIRWPKTDMKLQEEVLLPGSIRQLGSDSPFLDHMILSGCLNESHLREAIQRVVSHL